MRTVVLLFFSLLTASLSAQGQSVYDRFVENGKAWRYRCWNQPTSYYEYYEYTLSVCGDTVIGGQEYKKICQNDAANYQFALREENRKVYMVACNHTTPQLLYDFNLKKGDTVSPNEGEPPYVVTDIDTVSCGGRLFRRFHFSNEQGWTNTWIEGIGSPEELRRLFTEPGQSFVFLSCQVNGDTIFTSQDFYAAGMTNALPTVSTTAPAQRNPSLFDLQGRRLTAVPTRGLYVKDGRKYVK